MFRILFPILWVILLIVIAWGATNIIRAIINWMSKEPEPEFHIGPKGRVNDQEFGDQTIYTPGISGAYMAFVLLPDEFWYPIVNANEKAILFPSIDQAQQKAAQILATEGYPVILPDEDEPATPGSVGKADIDFYEDCVDDSYFLEGGNLRKTKG